MSTTCLGRANPTYDQGKHTRKATTMTTAQEIYSPTAPGRLGGWINRNGPVLGAFAAIFALWEIAVRALHVPD